VFVRLPLQTCYTQRIDPWLGCCVFGTGSVAGSKWVTKICVVCGVACNSANDDSLMLFERSIRDDSDFHQWAYLLQKLFGCCCCCNRPVTEAFEARLRIAIRRVSEGMPLPPTGNLLLEGDDSPRDPHPPMYTWDEDEVMHQLSKPDLWRTRRIKRLREDLALKCNELPAKAEECREEAALRIFEADQVADGSRHPEASPSLARAARDAEEIAECAKKRAHVYQERTDKVIRLRAFAQYMEQQIDRDGVHGLAAATTSQAGHWVPCSAGPRRGGDGPEGSARSTAGGTAGGPAGSAISLPYSPSPSLPVREDTRGGDERSPARTRSKASSTSSWVREARNLLRQSLSTTAPPRESTDSRGTGGSYERVSEDDPGRSQPSLAPGGVAPTPDRLVSLDIRRQLDTVRSMTDLQEALAQEVQPAGGFAAQAGVSQATAVPGESPIRTGPSHFRAFWPGVLPASSQSEAEVSHLPLLPRPRRQTEAQSASPRSAEPAATGTRQPPTLRGHAAGAVIKLKTPQGGPAGAAAGPGGYDAGLLQKAQRQARERVATRAAKIAAQDPLAGPTGGAASPSGSKKSSPRTRPSGSKKSSPHTTPHDSPRSDKGPDGDSDRGSGRGSGTGGSSGSPASRDSARRSVLPVLPGAAVQPTGRSLLQAGTAISSDRTGKFPSRPARPQRGGGTGDSAPRPARPGRRAGTDSSLDRPPLEEDDDVPPTLFQPPTLQRIR
jgi:hypothetical protein